MGEMDDNKRNNQIIDIEAKLNYVSGKVEKIEAQLVEASEAHFVKRVQDENCLSTPTIKKLTYGHQILIESTARWKAQLEAVTSNPRHPLTKASKKFLSIGESLMSDVLLKGNTPGNTYYVGECGTSNLRYEKLFQLEKCCLVLWVKSSSTSCMFVRQIYAFNIGFST